MKQTTTKGWRPAPLVVVLATAAFTLTTLLGVGWLNARRARVKARVEIAAPELASVITRPAPPAPHGAAPAGEVQRLAERVREATGLLYGLTLLAMTEQMKQRRLASVNGLLHLFVSRGLLPPGMQAQPQTGACTTAQATIYVRYRPQPLGLEVISVGREPLAGPAVIGRLSAAGAEQTGALLLIAKQSGETVIPAPFAPLEQVVALGWRSEPWRESSSPAGESERLRQWARQYSPQAYGKQTRQMGAGGATVANKAQPDSRRSLAF